jgi:cytochrome b561
MDLKNIPANSETSQFLQEHSASLIIWHWLTFLFLTASVITVLINSTLLSPRENIKLVQDQLQSKGVTVNNEQAFAVSHEYEDKMWEVHKYIGYVIALLLLSRVVIEFTQSEEEKVRTRLKKAIVLSRQEDGNSAEYKHYIRVKQSYILFFVLLLLMTITGLGLAFGHDVKILGDLHRPIKSFHSFLQYLMYAFIFIHLAGVIIAENGKMRGIVSGMIHGNH